MKLQNLSYKTLFTIFFFAIAGIIFLLKIGGNVQNVSATWWDANWHYRVSIGVTNTSGVGQTNAIVKVLSNYDVSSLVSAGKLQSDLDDLRFTDNNDTAINYWIQDPTNTSVDVWAVVPSVPTSGTAIWMYYGNSSVGTTFSYTYTGSSQLIDDGYGNFRVKFLSSGTMTVTNNTTVDAFLVGGGGGGGAYGINGGGGGGGYTTTQSNMALTASTNYSITVGTAGAIRGNGGTTSFNSFSASGGYGSTGTSGGNGGSGGGGNSGGTGGSDGSNGGNGSGSVGGTGQKNTTREFGETSGDLYSGGGGGVPSMTGGSGGGGTGADGSGNGGSSGTANTGGGGGFNHTGGTGIVVIRNSRSMPFLSYTGTSQFIDDGSGQFRIKFLSSGTLSPTVSTTVDAFLVGGGGGGGAYGSRGGGGGAGYTTTQLTNTLGTSSYSIVIGVGGNTNTNGTSTSAFGLSASGGITAPNDNGGNGGSGGGAKSYSGGTNGGNGTSGGGFTGGTGQGTTTKEFTDASGTLYAGGGGGISGAGGAGGGGTGANSSGVGGSPGTPNTGGGGGFNNFGGSGIVVIRKLSITSSTLSSTEENNFTPTATPTPTVTPTPTPLPAPNSPSTCLIDQGADNTVFTLKWADNSSDENGFKVYKNIDSAGFSLLATLGVNANTYVDTPITPGHSYGYKVVSYYTAGGTSPVCDFPVLNPGLGSIKFTGF